MKKLLAMLLALVMVLSCAASLAEGVAADATKVNTLIVGSPTLNGDFIDDFGNSAYDNWVKLLLMEYTGTMAVANNGEIVENPMVVAGKEVTEDEAGNKTYTWTLQDDLKWSDGSAITAQDFVAALLWRASSEWVKVGGSTATGYYFLGYSAYQNGETPIFAGVKLIDDLTFSVTIDAEQLPYYWEASLANVEHPIPFKAWAPELSIVSTDEGASFAEDRETVLAAMERVSQTERLAPTIAGGPFTFVSFENGNVTLKKNPYFKGDLDGNVPQLEYVVVQEVPSDTDVDMVISRDIDLVPANVEGSKIEAAKASDNTSLHSYLRYGYGMISIICNWGPTADPNVRWALAYLIDRNEVLNYCLGGYGGIVHGLYGYAEWAYQEVGDELEEMLTPFSLNVEKANELLDQTEWKYEADGVTPFDASKANAEGTYMRYNDKGEKLVVRHMGTAGLTTTDSIEISYAANAPLAGLDFQVTKSDFNALLDNYYYSYDLAEDEKLYSTFNMGNTFGNPNDPYESWHSDFYGTWQNACQVNDPELDELIMKLRGTEPGDEDAFLENWLAFQVRWQELLPQIPLYSNEYFEIFDYAVKGVNTSPFHEWPYEICNIYKVEDAQAEKVITTNY